MSILKTAVQIAAIFAFGAFLAGCKTVEGAGKDIESGGQTVQDGAKTVQKKL